MQAALHSTLNSLRKALKFNLFEAFQIYNLRAWLTGFSMLYGDDLSLSYAP